MVRTIDEIIALSGGPRPEASCALDTDEKLEALEQARGGHLPGAYKDFLRKMRRKHSLYHGNLDFYFDWSAKAIDGQEQIRLGMNESRKEKYPDGQFPREVLFFGLCREMCGSASNTVS